MAIEAAYVHLRQGTVARTVSVTASVMVDLDDRDRILGIETLDGADWQSALVTLAMTGRLAVPERAQRAPEPRQFVPPL